MKYYNVPDITLGTWDIIVKKREGGGWGEAGRERERRKKKREIDNIFKSTEHKVRWSRGLEIGN